MVSSMGLLRLLWLSIYFCSRKSLSLSLSLSVGIDVYSYLNYNIYIYICMHIYTQEGWN